MPKNRDYNRPNQKWECGWTRDGKECPRGPTASGHCETKSECTPFKDGDRFVCARSAQRGGKCTQGPNPDGSCCLAIPPCQPVRSLRSKRALASWCVVGVALGGLLVAFGMPLRPNHPLSPGPLSNHHRSVLQECATCHGGSSRVPAAWLLEARDAHKLSQNCVTCHSISDHPFAMHSMDPAALAKITASRIPAGGAHGTTRALDCTSCHKEHHGTEGNLTALTNQQCQTCHTQQFRGFAKDHPTFDNYPFKRRTRILFDHGAHFGKYFGEKDRSDISCNQCHVADESGQRMLLTGFSKTCAECHEPAIRGVEQTAKGIVFWRLPGLDLKALAKSSIGAWPEDAEGKLTPYQKLFLLGDERFAADYAKIAAFDLTDLGSASPDELKSAARVAWALKLIPLELAAEGPGYLKSHLAEAVGRALTTEEVTNLMGAMPVEVLTGALHDWFPGIADGAKAFAAGHPPATRKITIKNPTDDSHEGWTAAGGWYRRTSEYAIKFRPRGHQDPFVVGWIELLESSKKKDPILAKAFDTLVDPKSPGTCMKCHSVDQAEDGTAHVNWMGKNQENAPAGFTRFVHSSHFSMLQEKGCITCHKVNDKADFDKNTSGRDPAQFSSNFLPIDKNTCATCHNGTDRAANSCQSCHNYHTEIKQGRLRDFLKVKTKM